MSIEKEVPPVGFTGDVPLKPGTVVDENNQIVGDLSDWSKKQLHKLGLSDKDAVPEGFSQKLSDIYKEVHDNKVAVDKSFKLKKPKPVDIDDLPPEKQKELKEFISRAMTPKEERAPINITSDLEQWKDLTYTAEPVSWEIPNKEEEPEVKAPKLEQTTNIEIHQHICPRCGWDVDSPWILEITEVDKENFLISILGQQQFEKAISVLKNVTVVFRSLSTKEADLVFEQLQHDIRNRRLLSDTEYMAKLLTYRLAMSIKAISYKDFKKINKNVLDVEFKSEEQDTTNLIKFTDWFNENILTTESLRRIIGVQFSRFQKLCEKLEAMAAEPDFWNGIG